MVFFLSIINFFVYSPIETFSPMPFYLEMMFSSWWLKIHTENKQNFVNVRKNTIHNNVNIQSIFVNRENVSLNLFVYNACIECVTSTTVHLFLYLYHPLKATQVNTVHCTCVLRIWRFIIKDLYTYNLFKTNRPSLLFTR